MPTDRDRIGLDSRQISFGSGLIPHERASRMKLTWPGKTGSHLLKSHTWNIESQAKLSTLILSKAYMSGDNYFTDFSTCMAFWLIGFVLPRATKSGVLTFNILALTSSQIDHSR